MTNKKQLNKLFNDINKYNICQCKQYINYKIKIIYKIFIFLFLILLFIIFMYVSTNYTLVFKIELNISNII